MLTATVDAQLSKEISVKICIFKFM
jgi:hypothetical protein